MKLADINNLEIGDKLYAILLDHPLALEDDRLEQQDPYFVAAGETKLKKFVNQRYAELDLFPDVSWNFSTENGFEQGQPKHRYVPGIFICNTYIEKGFEDQPDGRSWEVAREYCLMITDDLDVFNSQLDLMIKPIEEELNRKIGQLKKSKIKPVHPLIKKY